MKPYLIQTARFKSNFGKPGIDKLLRFDYMGSSEFEFGALPAALNVIRTKIKEYRLHTIIIEGKPISIFCKKKEFETIKIDVILLGIGNTIKLKDSIDFYDYITESKGLWKNKSDFYWDILNHFMFWKRDDILDQKIINAIRRGS